jgi:hypothetical protein
MIKRGGPAPIERLRSMKDWAGGKKVERMNTQTMHRDVDSAVDLNLIKWSTMDSFEF